MEAPKNKGGRPTKAEQLAKGIQETELKRLLAQLRKVSPTILADLISEIENSELSLKEKIKIRLDVLKLYESLLKTNKALLATNDAPDTSDDASTGADDGAPVVQFRLAG